MGGTDFMNTAEVFREGEGYMARRERSRGRGLLLIGLVVVTCAAALGAQGRDVQPFHELLPPDTMFYLSWQNPGGTRAWRNSALYKIGKEPEMQRFIDHLSEQYSRLRRSFESRMSADIEPLEEALRHRLSVGLVSGAGKPPTVMVSAVLESPPEASEKHLLDALRGLSGPGFGGVRSAFRHRGYEVTQVRRPGAPIYYTFMGKRLLAGTSSADVRTALDLAAGQGESLAMKDTFRKCLKGAGGPGGMGLAYADVDAFLGMMRRATPGNFEPAGWVTLLQNVRALAFTSRFEDGGMRDSLYLHLPDRGHEALPAPGEEVDLSLLERVPANAFSVTLTRVQPVRLYDNLIQILYQMDSRFASSVTSAIFQLNQRAGFDLRDDLLGSLGPGMMLYEVPGDIIMLMEVADRKKFDRRLKKLLSEASATVEVNELAYQGTTIRHVDFTGMPMIFSPSYTFHKGYVVVGLYPQSIKRFLSYPQRGGKSITESADFQRVARPYLDGCAALSYSDTREGLAGLYQLLTMGAQTFHGIPQVPVRPELLPHTGVIEPYLFDGVSACMSREEGVLFESFSPAGFMGRALGLVGRFASPRSGSGSLAKTAFVTAIILPAISRARQAARRTKCMNNLREIAAGLGTWEKGHDGELPDSLGDLHPDYLVSPDILTCPSDDDPFRLENGLKCSYRYAGNLGGITSRQGAVVIAYDDRDNHGRGGNVLFRDYHTEWWDSSMFPDWLEESFAIVKRQSWDELSEQRKREIREFYGVRQR